MFSITADWERLDEGTPEERACFAEVFFKLHNVLLSEGHDPFVRRIRKAPLLSAYHLAEWLVWNWWRLRWEPRGRDQGWTFAHALSSIGEGYVWPNLTIYPDGERVTLVMQSSNPGGEFAFRYIRDYIGAIPASDFEATIGRFVEQVLGQLEAEGLRGSNLETLWTELGEERRDSDLASYRRLEAILGHDADEGDSATIRRLMEDEPLIGSAAALELAAEIGHRAGPIFASDLIALAETAGAWIDLRDAIRPVERVGAARGATPAWVVGKEAARGVRRQIGGKSEPLTNRRLAELVGTEPAVLEHASDGGPLSFALKSPQPASGRLVLRSRWETGRRFDLARILGDAVASGQSEALVPATRAGTYRQKLQRAFAAELLSPFEAVEEFLDGDYSDEQQEEAAEHFNVSPLTIQTMLVNHGRLAWSDAANDLDFDARAHGFAAAE